MKILYAINCDEIKVSDCDFLFLAGYNWRYCKRWSYYCCSNREIWNGQQIHGRAIHWFVAQLMKLEIPEGWTIDHKDLDKSNNERSNFRAASSRLQVYNTDNASKHPGVYFQSKEFRNKPWRARILMPGGTRKQLGSFETAEEASEVYQAAKAIRDKKEELRCQCLLTQKR